MTSYRCRVRLPDSYEWIYGDYCPDTYTFAPDGGGTELHISELRHFSRSTGAEDMHGKPIYEGDILLWHKGDEVKRFIVEVSGDYAFLEEDSGWVRDPHHRKIRTPLAKGLPVEIHGDIYSIIY